MDLPPESRHLDLYLAQLTLMDKNAQAYPLGRERTVDCLKMTAMALGTDREGLAQSPAVLGIINTNSPRQLDIPMSEAVLELAAAGQVCCITPFTLAGSMSPAVAGGHAGAANCGGAWGGRAHTGRAPGRAGNVRRICI